MTYFYTISSSPLAEVLCWSNQITWICKRLEAGYQGRTRQSPFPGFLSRRCGCGRGWFFQKLPKLILVKRYFLTCVHFPTIDSWRTPLICLLHEWRNFFSIQDLFLILKKFITLTDSVESAKSINILEHYQTVVCSSAGRPQQQNRLSKMSAEGFNRVFVKWPC